MSMYGYGAPPRPSRARRVLRRVVTTLVVLAAIGGFALLVRGCMEYTTRDYSAACLVTGRKHDRGGGSGGDQRYLRTRECGDLDVKAGSNTGWTGVEVGHRYQFRLRFYDRRVLSDYVEIRAVTDLEGHPVPPPRTPPA